MRPFGIYSLAFKEENELLFAESLFYLAIIIMLARSKARFLYN